MTFAQRILKIIHPAAEKERMQLRQAMARAAAEAEDVTRTVKLDSNELRKWLEQGCPPEAGK